VIVPDTSDNLDLWAIIPLSPRPHITLSVFRKRWCIGGPGRADRGGGGTNESGEVLLVVVVLVVVWRY
jgi:hypothetical protein